MTRRFLRAASASPEVAAAPLALLSLFLAGLGMALFLRRRRLVRAQDLAERLEVSERTIYRDVRDLIDRLGQMRQMMASMGSKGGLLSRIPGLGDLAGGERRRRCPVCGRQLEVTHRYGAA